VEHIAHLLQGGPCEPIKIEEVSAFAAASAASDRPMNLSASDVSDALPTHVKTRDSALESVAKGQIPGLQSQATKEDEASDQNSIISNDGSKQSFPVRMKVEDFVKASSPRLKSHRSSECISKAGSFHSHGHASGSLPRYKSFESGTSPSLQETRDISRAHDVGGSATTRDGLHQLSADRARWDLSAIGKALPSLPLPPLPPGRSGQYLLSDLSACELGCKDPNSLATGLWLRPPTDEINCAASKPSTIRRMPSVFMQIQYGFIWHEAWRRRLKLAATDMQLVAHLDRLGHVKERFGATCTQDLECLDWCGRALPQVSHPARSAFGQQQPW